MVVFKNKILGLIDVTAIVLVSLIALSFWMFALYPLLSVYMFQNPLVAYFVFTVIYTFVLWLFSRSILSHSPSLIKDIRYWFILYVSWLVGDIIIFPYLVTPSGVLPDLSVGATLSSDVFVYNLLPTFIPAIVRDWMTYCLIPSIGFGMIALLAKTKSDFITTIGRFVL